MRPRRYTMLIALIASLGATGARGQAMEAVGTPDGGADVIIDVRPSALCEAATLPGARCLPADEALGPHGRLANFSGLLWLFGTVGLTGRESVLIVGGPARERDFMAGLLYLAGQKAVRVLTRPVSKLGPRLAPGEGRSTTREAVYQAAMRSDRAILRSELLGIIRAADPPAILDARTEAEYWGRTVRAARGGHLPGAQPWRLPALGAGAGKQGLPGADPGASPVVYGHDAREGLAALARLVAAGSQARVYLEGWAGWASDGALPADSVTHAEFSRAPAPKSGAEALGQPSRPHWQWAGMILAGLALAAAGFAVGRGTAARG